MSTESNSINSVIEDDHVEESREEAQDLDWQPRNQRRARRQPTRRPRWYLPESYCPPATRSATQAARALERAQADPTETGSTASTPSISTPEAVLSEPTDRPTICERCFLRKEKHPDHECVKTTGTRRRACEWCRQSRQACRQVRFSSHWLFF